LGCYNVTCGITNISIGCGAEVVLIPLYTNGDREYSENPSSMFFTPYALPIKGDYNDYGGLENIERDENVEALENHFGITIDTYLKSNEARNGMFVFREVYDRMVEYHTEKMNKETSSYMITPNKVKEYLTEYKNSSSPLSSEELKKQRNALDKVIDEYSKNFKGTEKELEDDEEYQDYMDEFESICLKYMTSNFSSYGKTKLEKIVNLKTFDHYKTFIVDNKLDDYITDFVMFSSVMMSANKRYLPDFRGEQHGNTKVERALLNIMEPIISRKEKNEDYDD
jgi:hypothetical protein